MTISEAFPVLISKYEKCIEEITPLYDRDNVWKKLVNNGCSCGICHCFYVTFKYRAARKIGKALELKPNLSYLFNPPLYTYSKDRIIELLELRISAMKKAIVDFPNLEL